MELTPKLRRSIWVGALYFVSFLIPVGIAIFFLRDPAPQTSSELDPIFPSSIAIKSRGSFLTVADYDDMTPSDGKDFIFFGWFKFDAIPDEGQQMSLATKIDFSKATRPGFAIQISRQGDTFRPSVYWKNSSGQGSVFEFSDFNLLLGTWYGFVLTYRQPNILGLHIVNTKDDSKTSSANQADTGGRNERPGSQLLGGYELKIPVYPYAPNTPLTLGAPQFGSFRGAVGPVGIITGESASKNLRTLIKILSKNPLDIARYIPKKDLVFLTVDGNKDIGPNQLAIQASSRLSGS